MPDTDVRDSAPLEEDLPLFQRLLAQAVEAVDDDLQRTVLRDFALHVAGPLSDRLGAAPAKGGNFFRAREAEERENTARYRLDQTLRAHLVNGLLPVLRIARYLADWGANGMRYWGEIPARLFVAGFVLHDYAKLPDIQAALRARGFREHEPPAPDFMPRLVELFRQWCEQFGLDLFLEPIGGSEKYLLDLMYIATNTQRLKDTARNLALYQPLGTMGATADARQLATDLSYLADLLAYVAPNPRALVRHRRINEALRSLSAGRDLRPVARLTYHHVAENRGLLLNFIHDAALAALTQPGWREPLLYAPSGVVYLERAGAPPVADEAQLVQRIVATVHARSERRLVDSGKGAKRGNTGLQTDAIYDDFLSLPDYIKKSPKLVSRHIRNNLAQKRLNKIVEKALPGANNLPAIPEDPKDPRLDQLAEWAALVERSIRDRMGTETAEVFTRWLVTRLELQDLYETFQALRQAATPRITGGIFVWWFWLAAHWLARHPGTSPEEMIERLDQLSGEVADDLLDPLPKKAQANREMWDDLADYVSRVLTLGDGAAAQELPHELAHYAANKRRSGSKACALCGNTYNVRTPSETTVAFQPGVYTSRLPIGKSENARFLCSICALEQLLRQLYLSNLDSGARAEGQRVRYLSLYPTYFFTPETLDMTKRAYQQLTQFTLRGDLKRRIENLDDLRDPAFWQRLDPFLLDENMTEDEARRILRFDQSAPATFLLFGLRNFGDPTDCQSWVIPTFLALVLPLCLDVKVVVSESGTPLMLEADELPETVWLDGAHPAIRTMLDSARQKVALEAKDHYKLTYGSGRINVDEIQTCLAWLVATYMIHLDTEAKGKEDNWGRLPAIAHSLVESPLYVFYHLKRQERGGERRAGREKVQRYMGYAELLSQQKENGAMSHARTLVDLYRGFYRAKNFNNSNSILRPLSVVADALLNANPRVYPDAESLVEVANGELYRFMDRVRSGAADGRFPRGVPAAEREAKMREFCAYFVNVVFAEAFNGDVAALRGRQLNLLRSACEVIYRAQQYEEWAAGRETDEADNGTQA